MSNETLALFFAVGATFSFATASLVFADYAKKVSVVWMNCFKALVSFTALIVTVPMFGGWHEISWDGLAGFLLSGLIGLNIGDLFLFSAFTRLGSARTLILFGFQPLFVGVAAYFLFDQKLNPARLLAVFFLIACLLCFSLEKYRTDKHWELRGLAYAMIGVAFDTAGTLITKAAFTASPSVTSLEGHFWRCLGALLGFLAISCIRNRAGKALWPIHLWSGLLRWTPKTRAVLICASLGGTYLSLILFMSALRIGQLASISAIAITGPMFATLLESVTGYANRRAPSLYLAAAFTFFCAGFYVLLTTS